MEEFNKKKKYKKHIRTVWDFNPKTRVKGSKKEYNRNAFKRELEELYEEELNEDDDI